MKTKWLYNKEYEALRILETCHNTGNGFYKINGFMVLPFKSKENARNSVLLPSINYLKFPNYWTKINKINYRQLPIDTKKDQIDFITKEVKLDIEPNLNNLEQEWKKVEAKVLREIANVQGIDVTKIKSIKIYKSKYGPITTFKPINRKLKEYNLKMYIRESATVVDLVFAIVSSFIYHDVIYELKLPWSSFLATVDWVVFKSKIAKVLNTNIPPKSTLLNNREQPHLIKQSEKFYRLLGISNKLDTQNFEKLHNLTPKEKEVIKELGKNRGQVISYDEIAKTMHMGENEFSLYAISKTIERLRKKLEKNGISGSYIQTVRGSGYLLKK